MPELWKRNEKQDSQEQLLLGCDTGECVRSHGQVERVYG
jgi:hypothetical protein